MIIHGKLIFLWNQIENFKKWPSFYARKNANLVPMISMTFVTLFNIAEGDNIEIDSCMPIFLDHMLSNTSTNKLFNRDPKVIAVLRRGMFCCCASLFLKFNHRLVKMSAGDFMHVMVKNYLKFIFIAYF